MTPQRWRELKQLVGSALAVPEAEREAFVRGRAAQDSELCGQALSLLSNASLAEGFLSAPAAEAAGSILDSIVEARHQPVPAGALFGPYQIVGLIGAGGMGEVYRARDERLKRDVAIKVLPPAFTENSDRLRRFEQEARAAGGLNHPNILAIHDIGSKDGTPYVVSELLEGDTLRSRLASGALPVRKAIDYAVQVARGLAAAHEKGIVHRDLKPENLFITRDGRVKILDFGLAKVTRPEESASHPSVLSTTPAGTEPGVVMGTVGYMSPEQVRGERTDARSDIFSLGAILYEMLSGRRAFQGSSPVETMSTILKDDPPDLSATSRNVSPGLERIVRHCLEKSPEERFQSARDLAFNLEALTGVSGASPAVRGPSQLSRLWRRPLLALALLAIVFLATWGANAIRQKPSTPSYKRLTFRRGTVYEARFAPDGQTVVYSASWEGQPPRIFATRAGSIESRSLQLPDARVLAISSTGELAISIGHERTFRPAGTLARVPLEAAAPRELLESVSLADWSPDGHDLAIVHIVGDKNRLEFPIGKVLYESEQDMGSMRLSPRGDRLAVVVGEDLVTVDLSGKATTLLRKRGIGNLAWRPDGGEIWFSAASRPSEKVGLYAVTLSGRERCVRREAGALVLHDISRDGRTLLTDSFEHQSLMGLSAGQSAERELSWMDMSYVGGISNDGRAVVFDESGEGISDKEAVYVRAMDGSAAVRLGEGHGLAFSPDGRWVLSRSAQTKEIFELLPTGPGEPRPLKHIGIASWHFARFFPDGKRVLFVGQSGFGPSRLQSGSGPSRLYVQDLDGGDPRAISAEGISSELAAISPDGRFVAAMGPDSKIAIYQVDGGTPRPLAGAEANEVPILWSADGRSLYAFGRREVQAQVFKIDIATSQRELWKTIGPADRSGVVGITNIVLTPDARSYAYSYHRMLTSLEVADGLR
jgi:serine/threonine protein kinase/Tol biopolymer transport system component